MGLWEKIARSNFLIRLRSCEYWPFAIVQFPAIVYWLWLSIRSRSLVFFSASNPGIPMGGMFGESKYDVLRQIPADYVPQTLLMRLPASAADVTTAMARAGMKLPVILKPDLGERGYMVTRVAGERDIERYLEQAKADFLVQELVALPLEFGVFYMRFPAAASGEIISVAAKEMLSVTGDGASSIRQLILQSDRAKLQWKNLARTYGDRLGEVLPQGKKLELVSIGNHCLGTKFINANHLVNARLRQTFDCISSKIPGFNFGRFDLRCATVEDLYNGKIKIMELNGCGAEPAHIYDPAFPLFEALMERVRHWDKIYRISRENNRRGVRYVRHRDALKYFRKFRAAVK